MTKTFEEVWSEMTGRQHHALHMKLWAALGGKEKGADNLGRLMAGEIQLSAKEAAKRLFDKTGRIIPHKGLKAAVSDPNRDYYFKRHELNFVELAARYARYAKLFGDPGMGLDEFRKRSEMLIVRIVEDGRFAGILNGVYLPVILPHLSKEFDYGEFMEERLLRVVERAYRNEYTDRQYYDHRSFFEDHNIELRSQLSIVHPSHQRLVEMLMDAPQLGIFFPNALGGFSVDAAREQMRELPNSLILSGGLDTAVAMAVYPDVLAGESRNPNLYMPALSWRSCDRTLIFEDDGRELRFGGYPYCHSALGDHSAGLLYLG